MLFLTNKINYFNKKYSARGPRAKAGKKAKAAKIIMTAYVIIENVPVSVLNVPADSGITFFDARMPAMATGPIMGRNLPISITNEVVTFQNKLLSDKPSNPLPLLAAHEVY